jgi:DNA polymerase-3 subunit chi
MSQVDFYVLSQGGEQERQLFACRLAEKAYRLEHSVHIRAASRAEAARLDDLLWTFRDGSFVPHSLVGSKAPAAPVSIGAPEDPEQPRDLLINLADDLPANTGAFPRIAELVSSDEDSRQRSRQRFAAYREQGHDLSTHQL